ncbi:MAG: sulfotransferase family 2 domain-containing protein [Dehalococcoidales bacterium]
MFTPRKCCSTSVKNMCLGEKGGPEITRYAAIVRNPYDRLVSTWACRMDKTLKASHYGKKHKPCTFDVFLSRLPKFDLNTMPMCKWLPDELGFLIKYENLEEDWKQFGKWVGRTLPPLILKNKSKRDFWQFYYSDDQLDTVYQIYEQDFIKYGYTSARRDKS